MTKTASEFDSIQEAMKATVGAKNDSGLTVADWAHRLGHAESTMYAKGGVVPFTIDDLVKITASGFLRPLEYLAQIGKAVVVELPQQREHNAYIISKVAESAIKFGELLKTFSKAQHPESEGGIEITPGEAAMIKGKAHELAAAVAAIIEGMNEILRDKR